VVRGDVFHVGEEARCVLDGEAPAVDSGSEVKACGEGEGWRLRSLWSRRAS
jgi:hypothetical protein